MVKHYANNHCLAHNGQGKGNVLKLSQFLLNTELVLSDLTHTHTRAHTFLTLLLY